jgi:hypothetical protein
MQTRHLTKVLAYLRSTQAIPAPDRLLKLQEAKSILRGCLVSEGIYPPGKSKAVAQHA